MTKLELARAVTGYTDVNGYIHLTLDAATKASRRIIEEKMQREIIELMYLEPSDRNNRPFVPGEQTDRAALFIVKQWTALKGIMGKYE